MEVRELWRYPVKSRAGERVEAAWIAASGLAGDRVVQPTTERGKRVTARRFPRLLGLDGTLAEDGTALVDGHRWDGDDSADVVAPQGSVIARATPSGSGSCARTRRPPGRAG